MPGSGADCSGEAAGQRATVGTSVTKGLSILTVVAVKAAAHIFLATEAQDEVVHDNKDYNIGRLGIPCGDGGCRDDFCGGYGSSGYIGANRLGQGCTKQRTRLGCGCLGQGVNATLVEHQ